MHGDAVCARVFQSDGMRFLSQASEVLPPFRPASLIFFPQPDIDDLSTLERSAQVLANMMEDNAVLMGRDSAETVPSEGGEGADGAETGEGVDEAEGAGGASPSKRGRKSGAGVKDHFRVQKVAKKSSSGEG